MIKNRYLYLANEATEWENTTPIGCGRLGAALWGGVKEERIDLNEESIWAGGPMDIDATGFYEKYLETRALLMAGKCADDFATAALNPYFRCIGSYETAGALLLTMANGDGPHTDYRRVLDMENGVATVSYTADGVHYKRTAFASYPAQCIVVNLEADAPGRISFTARYVREKPVEKGMLSFYSSFSYAADFTSGTETVRIEGDDTIAVSDLTATKNRRFDGRIRFLPVGGSMVTRDDGTVTCAGCDSVCIYLDLRVSDDSAAAAPRLPKHPCFDALYREHTADFSSIMGRAALDFAYDDALDALPVNERLARVKDGATDTGLVGIYFTFGRYLLLSSGRAGTLPANLQGVWSPYMAAPWNSDYHTNINLQMNYWHAETTNLPECAVSLFDYMNNILLEGGKRVARDFYRCGGAVLHHVSDIYGFASPADGLWGLWPMGGAWLCYALWEHYLFAPDREFLKTTAYPYMEACTRFFLDISFEDENGYLATGPSTSPENRYFMEENGEKRAAYLCLSPTMDISILRGLFEMYIKTEAILGINPVQKAEAEAAYAKLPPLKIGERGQLMEWQRDYEEPEPGHRHISHAFGLYPGWEITKNTPDTLRAVEKSLELRLKNGGGHTGWSAAWLICHFARLGKGDDAADMIRKLLAHSTKDNLFDSHPPFQIDGNFGATAGLAEMVLQSHTDVVELLPALPADPAYQKGAFRGLRARGGITVSAQWENGAVNACTMRCDRDAAVKVSLNGEIRTVALPKGEDVTLL